MDHLSTDVLVVGAGAAGMYASVSAAKSGADVMLCDKSLISRGGATVMAQMTVAGGYRSSRRQTTGRIICTTLFNLGKVFVMKNLATSCAKMRPKRYWKCATGKQIGPMTMLA
jgi:thioredoxin reductase